MRPGLGSLNCFPGTHSQDLRLCGSQNSSFSITWTQARNNKLLGTPRFPALDLLEVGLRIVHWDSSTLGTGMQAPVEEPLPRGRGREGGNSPARGFEPHQQPWHMGSAEAPRGQQLV